jgi:hypothetical protein
MKYMMRWNPAVDSVLALAFCIGEQLATLPLL